MPRKFYKHKLLLDEGFHLKQRLPILNSRFNVKHVSADYKLKGLPDPQVFQLAIRDSRLLITYNSKDFEKLIEETPAGGVIGISSYLSVGQIDKKLTALLNRSTKKSLLGKLTIISGESEV